MSRHKKTQKQPDLGGADLVAQAEADVQRTPQPEIDTSFRARRTEKLVPKIAPINWTDAYEKFNREIE